MTPLKNNTHLSSATFPHPTDDNSNGNSEHNEDEDEVEEDEDEEEDNDANEVNILVKNQRGTSVTNKLSVNQQLANPNLKNYQGTLTKSDTNPIDINMKASKVISGQPLPLDSNIKIRNAALLRRGKRPKNKKVIKNKKPFTAAPEASLGIESNIITVNNPGIANSTHTVSNDPQDNIAESEANSMQIPDTQEPQSMTGVQIPSQAINPAVTNSANTLIPKVPLSVPVSFRSRFFLQHEDVLSATLGSIYHLKTSSWNITLGSILALVKNRNSMIESVELPNYLSSGIKIKSDYGTSISQWLKHLEDVG
ncbi:hypothetical protein BY996DRAFT_6417916 [Phakopsora pachyrhizi]|nr:hypothetical protein BY996DRAFT_6417916 [Phakopsora pachyrhizi]